MQSFLLSCPRGTKGSTRSSQQSRVTAHRVLPTRKVARTLGALGHCSITLSLDGLETKVWSALPMWSRSRRNSDTSTQVSVPSCQSCVHIITQHYQQELMPPTLPQEEIDGSSLFGTLLSSAPTSLPLADFNPCPFTVMNHNHEQSRFQWVLWVLLVNYQT